MGKFELLGKLIVPRFHESKSKSYNSSLIKGDVPPMGKGIYTQSSSIIWPRRAIANERELRSCLGRVFNFKFGCIVFLQSKCLAHLQLLLELKTQHRFCPVS